MQRVLVGFSVNLETIIQYPAGALDREKVILPPGSMTQGIGGSSATVAGTLRSLGVPAKLLGAVGREPDAHRHAIQDVLTREGIDHRLLPVKDQTGYALVHLPDGGNRTVFGTKGEWLPALPFDEVIEVVRQHEPYYILATGVVPPEVELVRRYFAAAHSANQVLVPRRELVAERGAFEALLRQMHLVVMNDDEFGVWSGIAPDQLSPGDLAQFHGHDGPEVIVVTRNAHGSYLSTRDGQLIDQPAIDCGPVVDRTGAGDGFLAGLVFSRMHGDRWDTAMRFAAVVAGFKTTYRGAWPSPSIAEVQGKLSQTEARV